MDSHSGPAALAVAITATPTPTVAAAHDQPSTAQPDTATAPDPASNAQMFINTPAAQQHHDTTTAQARLAQSMAHDVKRPDPVSNAQPHPVSVTAVRSAHAGTRACSVRVAAQYGDGSLRYFTVAATAITAGTSFAVTGAPTVVTGPGRSAPAESPYTVTVPASTLGLLLATSR
ncbi:hypothetical protein ACIHIX_24560 [Streptomyces sp. NPDC051913]|uniref:hypothetical protein n=1 Tax=Streptomyces sp. NPDC051913 TaxID=3365676 RepID=UPI0037D4E8F2